MVTFGGATFFSHCTAKYAHMPPCSGVHHGEVTITSESERFSQRRNNDFCISDPISFGHCPTAAPNTHVVHLQALVRASVWFEGQYPGFALAHRTDSVTLGGGCIPEANSNSNGLWDEYGRCQCQCVWELGLVGVMGLPQLIQSLSPGRLRPHPNIPAPKILPSPWWM